MTDLTLPIQQSIVRTIPPFARTKHRDSPDYPRVSHGEPGEAGLAVDAVVAQAVQPDVREIGQSVVLGADPDPGDHLAGPAFDDVLSCTTRVEAQYAQEASIGAQDQRVVPVDDRARRVR